MLKSKIIFSSPVHEGQQIKPSVDTGSQIHVMLIQLQIHTANMSSTLKNQTKERKNTQSIIPKGFFSKLNKYHSRFKASCEPKRGHDETSSKNPEGTLVRITARYVVVVAKSYYLL